MRYGARRLLVSGSTTFTINPALRQRLPYEPARDLQPVARLARARLVLVVRADAPWKTCPSCWPPAILALQAGTQLLDVPYKGAARP